jgi:hypothetical protein
MSYSETLERNKDMGTHAAPRTAEDNARNAAIAGTIRSQIGNGVLMSLGATDFMFDGPALTFRARILNARKVKRIMRVTVRLEPSDTYSIRVGYMAKSRSLNNPNYAWISHYSADDVYADMLPSLLLELDNVL